MSIWLKLEAFDQSKLKYDEPDANSFYWTVFDSWVRSQMLSKPQVDP